MSVALTFHNFIAESDDLVGVLFPTAVQNGLVDRVIDQCHGHADDANCQTGDHGFSHSDGFTDVGHNKAHACAHDEGGNGTKDICKGGGGGLHLFVQCFQLVQLGVFLFGVWEIKRPAVNAHITELYEEIQQLEQEIDDLLMEKIQIGG